MDGPTHDGGQSTPSPGEEYQLANLALALPASFPPALRTRTPLELAPRPPLWSSEPFRSESAVSLAIASWSACGAGP